MSKSFIRRGAIGIVIAGALALFVVGSVTAAPVLSGTAQVKSAVDNPTTDVRYRHWRGYRGYAWRRGYAGRRYSYNSGCHVLGGYHRPDGCW